MTAIKALKVGLGWQIGDGRKARIRLDKWGFEGLDDHSLMNISIGR